MAQFFGTQKQAAPNAYKHPGLPAAVIHIRLLVPFTAQNLLNKFLG